MQTSERSNKLQGDQTSELGLSLTTVSKEKEKDWKLLGQTVSFRSLLDSP